MKDTGISRLAQLSDLQDFGDIWEIIGTREGAALTIYDDSLRDLRKVPYSELVVQARNYAARLKKRGVNPGDVVFVSAYTCESFVCVWLGLMWLGAIPVALAPRAAFFNDEAFVRRLEDCLVANSAHYIGYGPELDLITRAVPDGAGRLNLIDIERVSRERAADEETFSPYPIKPSDRAFMQFTSGSVKRPKGIIVNYGMLFSNIDALWKRYDPCATGRRFGSWLPLYHDMGLVSYFLGPIFKGMDLVLIPPVQFVKKPSYFLKLISEYSIQVIAMPNFAYELIMDRVDPEVDHVDFSSLKISIVAAEPVNPHTVRRFEEKYAVSGLAPRVVSPGYGLAEATLAVSLKKEGEPWETLEIEGIHWPTLGEFLDGFEVKINCWPGKNYGEVLLKGPCVADHAMVNGDIIKITDENGYYNTRDVGLVKDGRLIIMGRSDEMFIVNGENFFPYDIESLVRDSNISNRKRVLCFGVNEFSDQGTRTEVVVLCEAEKTNQDNEIMMREKIVELVRSRTGLANVKPILVAPRTIPITPSGKLRRSFAKAEYLKSNKLM